MMKILQLVWKSFGNEDIAAAFCKLGHILVEYPYIDKDEPTDNEAVRRVVQVIKDKNVDVVFSFNYFPVIGLACKELGMPYFSWIYDSPYVRLYHYSVAFPTNYIFVFDSSIYMEFAQAGISTVHYLPMAANVTRLDGMNEQDIFLKTVWKNEHDVAFVGSLYTEKHQFYQRMGGISDYTRGYLEGLMSSQKMVYGYNFIQESLKASPKVIDDMKKSLPLTVSVDGVESIEYLFAQYVVNRQITAMERQEMLLDVSQKFGLDLYTPDKGFRMPGCKNHGPVDYYDFAPYVFRNAKINLNISLRSIIAGVPLRAFDVMGAGGFLLSNYQSDFMGLFVPDEDFVYYDSREDMINKIDYYLSHEDERVQIAENGRRRIAECHTYEHRVEEMFSQLK